MSITTNTLRRAATLGTGLALSAVLTACSGGTGAETPQGSDKNQSTSTSTSQASGGAKIANPKNAAAVDVCSLLPPEAAKKLGVKPKGKKVQGGFAPTSSKACTWESSGGGAKKVSFAPIKGRSLQYYDKPSFYKNFKKFEIKGHPVLQANTVDPMKAGSCGMFLATKSNQIVQAFAATPKVGKVNPCDIAKKALKLSVPTWPAAK